MRWAPCTVLVPAGGTRVTPRTQDADAGRFDAALLTCERMLEERARLDLPQSRVAGVKRVMHGCIAMERRSRGLGGRLRRLDRS